MEPEINVKAFDSGVNGEIRYEVTLFRHKVVLQEHEFMCLRDYVEAAGKYGYALLLDQERIAG